MNKKQLSERDICSKYITPALEKAGWDVTTQVREEFPLTRGRIIVRGKLHTRARHKRADYVLFYKPNIPIAIIEAKDNNHAVGDGMQQALGYAAMLQVPFVFSSNGDGFLFHNKITSDGIVERELALHEFPAAETLWHWWAQHRGLNDQQNALVTQDYFSDGSDKSPRYYQLLAINKTIEAIARGQNRILLVMATGTGKTFTAFQIIWRLWKSKAKKRILFLADRNILVDQTMTNDFKPFGSAMTKIQKRQANKSYEIYLSLYQAVTGNEEEKNIYRQFSPDFFDLIIIDECQWHQFVLDNLKEMKFEEDELDEFRVLPGDLLICEGGEPGRCAIWNHSEREIYFQKAIHRARPFSCVTSEYLQACLTNDGGNGQLAKYFTGATIKHFPGDKLNGYVIPLPPLPEQHRIVARIDQLMALCDTLDQQIDAATHKQTELLGAVMAGVNQGGRGERCGDDLKERACPT